MEQTMTPTDVIEQQFKNVFDELGSFSKRIKELQDNVKILHKTYKGAEKSAKSKKKKAQVKLNLSSDLAKFLNVTNDIQMTKAEVMKGVSEYIKTNNLQLDDNRRKFRPNKQLHKVFGMNTKQPITFVEINKHVSSHLSRD